MDSSQIEQMICGLNEAAAEALLKLLNSVAAGARGLADVKSGLEEELRRKAEPKPLKLEAGCRVQCDLFHGNRPVVAFNDTEAWVDVGGPGCLSYTLDNLTVIEAATPEVGDMVKTRDHICFIHNIEPPVWFDLIHPGGDLESLWRVPRLIFTILHKAPKE